MSQKEIERLLMEHRAVYTVKYPRFACKCGLEMEDYEQWARHVAEVIYNSQVKQ